VENGLTFFHIKLITNMEPAKFKGPEDRALDNLKSMLTARGFKGDGFELVGTPLDDTTMYTFGGMFIVFGNKTRVSVNDLTAFIAYATENGHTHGMVVVTLSKSSETVLAFLRSYIAKPENMLVQLFEIRKLQIDIPRHRDVPKHRILPQEERAAVMKKFNIKDPVECPWIDSQDAMGKWIGARPGDLIEVTGLDEASATNVHYRYCLANVYEH
jgi:DNA-directed RNA polymerase subunit H (RpoH/RPB5)